jgi:peptide-methionine (S)-S-oxide reductase
MQAALSRRGAAIPTGLDKRTRSVTSVAMSATGGSSGSSGPRPSPLSSRAGRGALAASVVCAAGLFSWLTGGKEEPKTTGKYDEVLAAARKPQACPPAGPAPEGTEQIHLASGCYWGSELAAARTVGVTSTKVGYTQGEDPNPTYEKVCSGYTGHTEAVLVTYEKGADLDHILDEYLANFDPTTRNRQGGDRGTQYRSGVYYTTEEQRVVAERKLAEADAKARAGQGVTRSGRRWEGSSVVVELKPAKEFYIAEAYHQRYLERGGRFGRAQSAAKGEKTPIRCYG